jgi:hypothetical protein
LDSQSIQNHQHHTFTDWFHPAQEAHASGQHVLQISSLALKTVDVPEGIQLPTV